jgi:hypothetical protein
MPRVTLSGYFYTKKKEIDSSWSNTEQGSGSKSISQPAKMELLPIWFLLDVLHLPSLYLRQYDILCLSALHSPFLKIFQ